jgi:CHAT domain-containing protein
VLTGGRAGADQVLAAMGRADLVHLAAHGTFRSDSPQFSSLLLDDGALTVYDLEALDHPPATVVLPACSAARSEVRQGDELLGTTAALLRLGVRTVIAPVMAVADAATTDLSIALHERLAAGAVPSVALADAVARARASDDPLAASTALSFVCVGADDRVSG